MLLSVWCALGCTAVTYSDERRDAAPQADSARPLDASVDAAPPNPPPPPTPTFVQTVSKPCGTAQTCTISIPGTGSGQLLLVSITNTPQTVHVASVKNKQAQAFQRLIGPLAWGTSFQTELWWGKRSASAEAITISLSAPPGSVFLAYADEFVATSIDQTASASGAATAAGAISSGTRTLTSVPQMIFGHAEGDGATVGAGTGFTVRSAEFANIEETKSVSVQGTYSASFTLDKAGAWMAMMATLR